MAVWLLASLLGMVSGCGKAGTPLPPEPRGPRAPSGVQVRQIGREIHVSLTRPLPRGSRPSQLPVTAELLRVAYGAGQAANLDATVFARRSEIVLRQPLPKEEGRLTLELVDREWPRENVDPAGWTLRYGVRVRDVRGRPSALVLAHDLVVVPELPIPKNLNARATADGISLKWEPSSGGSPLYHVYRKTREECCWPDSAIHVGVLERPEFLDRGVQTGTVYRYTVRVAQDDDSPFRESADALPIEVLARDLFPPTRPEGLVAVQEGAAVRLFWNPSEARDLAGYRLFRRVNDGGWESVGEESLKRALYLDADVEVTQKIEYRVLALDRADPPNESEFSEIVLLEIGDQFE